MTNQDDSRTLREPDEPQEGSEATTGANGDKDPEADGQLETVNSAASGASIDEQTIVEPAPGDDEATSATVISLPPESAADARTMAESTADHAYDGGELSRTEAVGQTIVTGEDFADDGTVAESAESPDSDATMVSEAYSKAGGAADDDTSHEGAGVAGDEDAPPMIDRFRLIRLLGRGAFGSVYLAHDPKLDRKVAVKVARAGVFDSKREVEKFLREARSAAQLRHPNIVPVYEVGQSKHANFIVYEFIEGTSLKGLIGDEGGKLTHEHAASLTRQIAEALDYAHATGVVHRDIKPDNVLVDQQGKPHIADFGLARRDEDITRTQDGAIMGTPAYMSPEQASGQGNVADGRTDIWSLGVMFNEMLTGERPFTGTLTQVLMDVKEKEVRSMRQTDNTIPLDLDTVCLRCLAKKPEERFERASLLADELERWERGEPILSRRISIFARTARWARRNPVVASLIGAVCASLLLGAIVSTIFGVRASQELSAKLEANADRIGIAESRAVPELVNTFDADNDRERYVPIFRDRLQQAVANGEVDSANRLRYTLLHLDREAALDEKLHLDIAASLTENTDTAPDEVNLLVSALPESDEQLREYLWNVAEDGEARSDARFRATVALAHADPHEEISWNIIAPNATSWLLDQPGDTESWRKAIEPVGQYYTTHLDRQIFEGNDVERPRASETLARLLRDDVEALVDRVGKVEPAFLPDFITSLAHRKTEAISLLEAALSRGRPDDASAEQQLEYARSTANNALALIALGNPDSVIPLLQQQPDEEIRSHIIHQAGYAGIDPAFFLDQVQNPTDDFVLMAALLALGEYPESRITPSNRAQLAPTLVKIFTNAPHPGVHSAADWLMRKWNQTEELNTAASSLAQTTGPREDRKWFVENGMTFVVVDGPIEFELGSNADPDEYPYEAKQKWRIPRSFAVSTREVTVGDFFRVISLAQGAAAAEAIGAGFNQYTSFPARTAHLLRSTMLMASGWKNPISPNDGSIGDYTQRLGSTDPDAPMTQIRWLDAAKYCRLLSEQVGIPTDQCCYPAVRSILSNMHVSDAVSLNRTGYRLLTAAEWEYASRNGTDTWRHFGNSDSLLDRYAWFEKNSGDQLNPVGLLKPNSFGLFDTYGNAAEWCNNWGFFYDPLNPKEGHVQEVNGAWIDGTVKLRGTLREYRGGSYQMRPEHIRSAYRGADGGETGLRQDRLDFDIGFRIGRTLATEPQSRSQPAAGR